MDKEGGREREMTVEKCLCRRDGRAGADYERGQGMTVTKQQNEQNK